MQFLAFLRDGFRESRDRKIFWVMLVLSLLVALSMLSVSFSTDAVHLGFGAWSLPSGGFDPLSILGRSRIASVVVFGLFDFFLGTIGMVLMLIATAGMFPSMMEHGSIDVVLAKPLSRAKLFLYKYVGGLVFAAFQAIVFVGSTFLVMGFRWGLWIPGYLLSILLMVLLFSYIYCVSVLVAVKTRSVIASILLSLAAWVLFALPSTTLQIYEQMAGMKDNSQVYRVMKIAAEIVPKTAEIPILAGKWARAGTSIDMLPKGMIEVENQRDRASIRRANEAERKLMEQGPWWSIGSSLAFEAVVVGIGIWIFSRKDF